MKQALKNLSLLAAVPVGVGSIIAFHPGTAFAESTLTKLTPTAFTQSGTYKVDPMHSSIGFDIGHMGLARVQGRFNKMDGSIDVDPNDLDKSGVSFTIQSDSVDTAVAPRDTHLKSADFFEVEKYPTIKFKSISVKKVDEGYVVTGDLTIKDKTNRIDIPFKKFGPIADQGGGTRIGFIADTIEIDRHEFGVTYGQKLPDGTPSLSDEVNVRISLEATQAAQ